MPPHGPGFMGNSHSHDSKYPDDNWNLYSMIDLEATQGYNLVDTKKTNGIFKPHVHRFDPDPHVISDSDAEIIIFIRFTSPCSVRKINIIGGGELDHHPNQVKLYVNQDVIDFSNVENFTPAQTFPLAGNADGRHELMTSLHQFSNINSLTFYFTGNFGDVDNTIIQYIGK